jgi:hypothetical protein
MPFTSPGLVRAHLSGLRAGDLPIADVPVVLNGTQAAQLPHVGLIESSVTVKALRLAAPVREEIALAVEWTSLTYQNLVARSVVVASDNSLSTVYVENADYIVDYPGGRIRRLPEGSIPLGATITIWYDAYHIYIAGDDYTLDALNGSLRRTVTGTIADGQTVLVDYKVGLGTIADAVIENAIAEVDDSVLALLDPVYHDQPVPGIVIGETHWAVAAVCRMQAAATLSEAEVLSAGTHNLARVWLDLADRYDNSGRERLARFAAPQHSLRAARRN